MSQPKRYFLKISPTISGIRCDTYEDKDGEYVDYLAYAALQAENERLKSETIRQIESAMPPIEAYIAKLEAENQRLRKAGDAMENELFRVILMELPGLEKEDINNQYIAAWVAAKEGGAK